MSRKQRRQYNWTFRGFETPAGNRPVVDWIRELSPDGTDELVDIILYMRLRPHNEWAPENFKPLEDGISEIRFSDGDFVYRIYGYFGPTWHVQSYTLLVGAEKKVKMIEISKTLPNRDVMRLNDDRQTSTQLVSRSSLCRRVARGPEVRAKFVESHINKGIAYQLRAMRESRSWSQQKLAAEVGMPQTAISRLESSTYGKPTITTLKRMARVYDVALEVKFVPFSKLINKISGTPYIERGLSSDDIDVPSFEEEEKQGAFASAAPVPIARGNVEEISSTPQAEGLRNVISMARLKLASLGAPEKKHPSSEKNSLDLMEGGLADAAGIGATS